MASQLCLQLFLLLAFMAPHLTSARHLHSHKSSRLLFPKHLQGSRKGDNREGIHGVKAYLQRYGYYLPKNETNSNSHTNAFDDPLESSIKSYQRFFKLNASGVLDKETLDQMSMPRCGVTDDFLMEGKNRNNTSMEFGGSYYTFFPHDHKWPIEKKHLTYGFIHDYPPEHVAPVLRAFETWEANTKFSFSLSPRVQTADILFSFERGDHGDGHPFDGEGGELAHCFGPIDGRIHFDVDERWTSTIPTEQHDLESVALHEIGHALGLGHTDVQDAVMWPGMNSGLKKTRLHDDDLDGIRALYGN